MRTSQFPNKKNIRRIAALSRLQEQKKLGVKPERVAQLTLVTTEPNMLPLSKEDETRIEKELSILNNRIVSEESAKGTKTKKYRATR